MILLMKPPIWNLLILATLLLGSGFILATRPGAYSAAPQSTLPTTLLQSSQEPAPEVGHPAPPFQLSDLSGQPVRLEQFRGQVVLINIWATWCPPCRAEMPAIQATYERHATRGFVVLAINSREQQADVAEFMQDRQLSFPALLDSDGSVAALYRASALPSSFLIGRDGTVRVVYRGPLPLGVIDAAVDSLLEE
ncbi:MAG: TlpA disulfide reductase family protein [Roseiflexaceae bacterium]